MSDEQAQRTITDNPGTWNTYWKAQGMPWRIEPEIDEKRQRYLTQRRAVKPDVEKGVYPFRDDTSSIKLTRADIEWLLTTHESGDARGPVNPEDSTQWNRDGLDLRGADLSEVNLEYLPLARLQGGLAG